MAAEQLLEQARVQALEREFPVYAAIVGLYDIVTGYSGQGRKSITFGPNPRSR